MGLRSVHPGGAGRRGARAAEWVALGAGAVSGAALAVAALAPFNDPELVGRAAFAREAGRVEDGVRAEWERIVRDAALGGTPLEEAARVDARAIELARGLPAEPEGRARGPDPASARAPAHAPVHSSVRLLARAARESAAAGDAAGARTALEQAVSLQEDAPERARAMAWGLEWYVQSGDGASACDLWQRAAPTLDGAQWLEDAGALSLPAPLACALALRGTPCASGAAHEVAVRWCAGELALPPATRAEQGLDVGPLLRRALAAALSAQLDPGDDMHRALADCELARAWASVLGSARLDATSSAEAWTLTAHPGGGFWAWRRADAATEDAAFDLARVAPGALERTLSDRAVTTGLVSAGYRLVFGEEVAPGRGAAVRPPLELAVGGPSVTLWHDDPGGGAQRAAGRLALLRGALAALAALTVLTGAASWFALRRARRLADLKGAFVAGVSHELRTPLASILLLAENLEQGRVGGEEARARYATLIRREAERLRRLVSNVLDVARLERGRALELQAECAATTTVWAALEVAARAWARAAKVELACHAEGLGGDVRVDGEAFWRAVRNLLENARLHSGSRRLDLDAGSGGDRFWVAVEDDGSGVPPREREGLFAPFAQRGAGTAVGAHLAPSTGVGLGLAIVREVARAHGGEARFQPPRRLRGARVEIELPLHAPRQVASNGGDT